MEQKRVTTFGAFFKARRMALGKTLRAFCVENGLDPGNLSRLERGIAPPPVGRETLERYAAMLGLCEPAAEWYDFFDLAAAETGRVPEHILDEKKLAAKLPAVFRTLRGDKPTDEQLQALVELLKRA